MRYNFDYNSDMTSYLMNQPEDEEELENKLDEDDEDLLEGDEEWNEFNEIDDEDLDEDEDAGEGL